MQEPKHNADDARNFLNNIKLRNISSGIRKNPNTEILQSCTDYPITRLLDEAEKSAEKSDFATALALAELALKKEPENPFALYSAATFSLKQEQYLNCLKYIKQLINQQERSGFKNFDKQFLQFRLGDAYYFNGNYQNTKKVYESLLEQGYIEVSIYITLGLIYFSEEDYDAALMFFVKAYELTPDDMYLNTYIAAVYAKKEKYHIALEFAFKAEELGYTTDIYMYEEISRIYYCLDDYEKSLLYAQKMLDLDENSPIGLRRLGWAYYGLNKSLDVTYESFKKVIDQNYWDYGMFVVLIQHYLDINDFKNAQKYAVLMKQYEPDYAKDSFLYLDEKLRARLFKEWDTLFLYYVKLVLFSLVIFVIGIRLLLIFIKIST